MRVDALPEGSGVSMSETDFERGRAAALRDLRRALLLVVECGIILALTWAFRIESPAFYQVVLPMVLGGAVVHHWLPIQYRPLFFASLSLVGIVVVLGVGPGLWLIGVGLALIALCHVPVPFRWRIVLIAGAAALLLALRSAWLQPPWPAIIWPILGSMFMFRLAIYLYELKHKGPPGAGFALSYFFMLPNAVFLLFPVIDFQTFRRAYYDRPALDIYEEGTQRVFRGLTHLVLYRFIYHYVVLPADAVSSTTDIARFLVGNYGLYLRISGSFHVIVGLLHLYGFRLPETHRFFYLASSFSDLWRRTNIYWKDFMQKMVYLPTIVGLRRSGENVAFVGATVVVVAATWFLHSYQWFWLLGRWLLTPVDVSFWALLGLLLVATMLWEKRRGGRVRQLTPHAPAAGQIWREGLHTAATFSIMCVLLGFWASPTFDDFGAMLGAATLRASDIGVVVGVLAAITVAAFVVRRLSLEVPSGTARRYWWRHPLIMAAVPLTLVWAVGEPNAAGSLFPRAQAVAVQARNTGLNEADTERLTQGYYEDIIGVNRFNGELWQVYARTGSTPQGEDELFGDDLEGFASTAITERSQDALETVLRPSNKTRFKDGEFTTNRWGMRDRDYDQVPPAGTRRIAMLGPSYAMGTGVNDSETFEALLEERLNREWTARTGLRYESLNFSVAGYSLLKQAILMENGRVAGFRPDAILLIGNPRDDLVLVRDLARLIPEGLARPEAVAREAARLLRDAGADENASASEVRRLLRPHASDLARTAFQSIAAQARQMGIPVVYAVIPVPADPQRPAAGAVARLLTFAAEAGLLVIEMEDVYGGRNAAGLTLNEADHHPNRLGHQLIADRLFTEFVKLPPGVLTQADGAQADRTLQWSSWNREQIRKAEGLDRPATTRAAESEPRARSGGDARARVSAGARTAESGAAAGAAGGGGMPAGAAVVDGWELAVGNGSVARLRSIQKDDWMRIGFSRDASADDIKTRLIAPVRLAEGRRYSLRFWLKADDRRPVACGVADRGLTRLLGERKVFETRRRWIEFTCPFTATASDADARLYLDLSTSTVAVELTGVVLTEVDTGRTVAYKAPRGSDE